VTAFVVIWLATQGLTVTLQSQPMSEQACRTKLAEMLKTASQSGLEHRILHARCEGEGTQRQRRGRRRR